MVFWIITDTVGKVYGMAAHKSIAIDCVRETWPHSGGYQIAIEHELSSEIKMVIRQHTRIGENPNETLILKTIYVTACMTIDQKKHL